MDKDRFKDFDEEERQLVLDFENTVLRGVTRFFDIDELEIIIDYYFEVGDRQSLERAVEYAEELYPDSSTVRLRRAHLLIANERFEPAMRIIRELRRLEPKNTDVAYSMGVAYGAMGEHEKAIKLYQEAAEDGWMLGRVYANIAEEYYSMDNFDEAIRYYQLALDTDSYDSSTLYNYVDTAMFADRTEEAVDYLISFVGEHPYSAEGWHCLGTAYLDRGLLEKAVDAFEYSIAIDKNNVNAYLDLSLAQEMSENYADAVTTLLRACEVTSNHTILYQRVADIYLHCENNTMALLYLRKAIEESPDDPGTNATLALVYALSGEYDQAMPLVRKAVRALPDDARTLSVAAFIYDSMGNFDAALDYFDRAVSAPNCDEMICQQYVDFLFRHSQYYTLTDFLAESLDLYPNNVLYSTYMAAACFYTNRYNRVSRVLPDVDPVLLGKLCPQIFDHPRLGPLVPEQRNKSDKSNNKE